MKRILTLFFLLLSVSGVQAQKQQPTPSPLPTEEVAVTSEADDEAPHLSEVFVDLPQSRAEDGAFVLGDPDAPVTIVIFSDWACPHCQVYHEAVESMLAQWLLAGQMKLEHRIFPTAGGSVTVYAGQVAECADDLHEGGFWQSYFLLYDLALAGDYDPDTIVETIADELDIDEDDLETCALKALQVGTDVAVGQDAGVQGTPAVMIRYGDRELEFIELDDQLYDRGGVPVEVLQAAIEAGQDLEVTSENSE